MTLKKIIVVFVSVLAIFALLALIRRENNMLVSARQQQPSTEKAPVKQASIATRDV